MNNKIVYIDLYPLYGKWLRNIDHAQDLHNRIMYVLENSSASIVLDFDRVEEFNSRFFAIALPYTMNRLFRNRVTYMNRNSVEARRKNG